MHHYSLTLVQGNPALTWKPLPPEKLLPHRFYDWVLELLPRLGELQLGLVASPTFLTPCQQRAAACVLHSLLDEASLKEALTLLLNPFAVDWALEPLEAYQTPKRLLLSDMDSTLLQGECIDELAAALGIKPQIAAITEQAMRGELPFEAALRERVALLKGLPLSAIDAVLAGTPLMDGAETLMARLHQDGVTTVVVSGGFTPFTEPLRRRLGMAAQYANTLGVDAATQQLTGEVIPPIVGAEAKLSQLEAWASKLGLPLSQTLAVGDGANDLPMLQAAGMGVAFHAKPQVEAAARFNVRYGGLEVILFYLGLPL